MIFAWRSEKSSTNEEKHGLALSVGVLVWSDDHAIVLPATSRADEKREMLVGIVDDRVISEVFIVRQDVTRIISVRSASRQERRRYREING